MFKSIVCGIGKAIVLTAVVAGGILIAKEVDKQIQEHKS